jgi:hypothetical protein
MVFTYSLGNIVQVLPWPKNPVISRHNQNPQRIASS